MTPYSAVDITWLVAAGLPLGAVVTLGPRGAPADRLAICILQAMAAGGTTYAAWFGAFATEWGGSSWAMVSTVCSPLAWLGIGVSVGTLVGAFVWGVRTLRS